MRKLLIVDNTNDDITDLCTRLDISEIATGIPRRYLEYVSSLPTLLIESANQPEQILRVLPIDNPRAFTYDFNTIEELPVITPPLKLEDRIQELENRIKTLISERR